MKVTFDKQKLLAALNLAASINQTKNTIAITEGLLFECPPMEKFGAYDKNEGESMCRISAYDLDKGLRILVPCDILEPGCTIINTSKILQIARVLPDGPLTIDIDEKNKVTMSAGSSNFEITAANGEDFPAMPMLIGDTVFTMPQYLMRAKIDETAFAVAVNDPRPAFNGALCRIENGDLTFVGCDGFRMAASKCTIESGDVPDTKRIIPGKFLLELSKMLKDSEEDVTIIIGRKHIIFKLDSMYFFTRMIESEYIDYEQVLSNTKIFRTEVFVSRKELLDALDRVSLITEDKFGGNLRPPVRIDVDRTGLSLSASSQGGSVFEKVSCDVFGADLTIGFKCRYLIEALKSCPDSLETLRIRLNKPTMPIVIEPVYGSGFVDASPDAEAFRGVEKRAEEELSEDTEKSEEKCLYLLMPYSIN